MAHDVFISYSHKDKSYADAICVKLEADGCRCWYAPRDIPPGVEWASAITDAIKGSKAFILVFTDSSNVSSQVLREITMAASYELPIIPFKLTETAPSKGMEYYLSTVHWLDAINAPQSRSIAALAERVEAILRKQPAPERMGNQHTEEPAIVQLRQEKKPGQDNKTKILIPALIALVVLLIAVVVWQTGFFGGKKQEPGQEMKLTEASTEAPAAAPTETPTAIPSETPTETPAQEPSETAEWGEYGTVRLMDVVEWSSGMADTYPINGQPNGKWVVVEFSLERKLFPEDALNLASEILRLDDYEPTRMFASGIKRINDEVRVAGVMGFIFDVPADYDPSLGVVTVNGAVMKSFLQY